jgi:hypothetical protein
MLTTVEGIYKDGQIELAEKPADFTDGKVLVTFLSNGHSKPVEALPKPGQIYRGMFKTDVDITEEDFKIAEFHGDPDDGLDWS